MSAPAAAAATAASSGRFKYQSGYGNMFETEALPGALPERGNTPQKCAYGLYAEQINGSAFTAVPRSENLRTWWYRIRPSIAGHGPWTKLDDGTGAPTQWSNALCEPTVSTPEQIRWQPLPMPAEGTKRTFVDGLHCYCGAGDPAAKAGIRIYVYACNADMTNQAFSSSDGDFLIVPQEGSLTLKTECGHLEVPSGFICVVPRGIRFSVVNVPASGARGYVAECFDSHFSMPPMGVIGTNGLTAHRDVEYPVAAYEDIDTPTKCFVKYCGSMWSYDVDHSIFDVVAWHGNYAPFRYDLAKYCVINSVSFDHLDPSIFCVFTAQTAVPGVACCDFVIFPPRWMVQDKSFRPPYYHRNCMSEFMGNIRGAYEAKKEGFLPGGASLHSHMQAHGPEAKVFDAASNAKLVPERAPEENLAFMFESYYTLKLTKFAAENLRDSHYLACWSGFKKYFNPEKKEGAW
jgi:homogentisate 1,2-dioxygenase